MRILGYNYRVVRDGLSDDIGALGRWHLSRQRIQIAEDLVPEQVVSTILHEILEAIKYHAGLDMEHSTIFALESALYQVLTDAGVDLTPLAAHLEEPYREPAPLKPYPSSPLLTVTASDGVAYVPGPAETTGCGCSCGVGVLCYPGSEVGE